MGAEERPPPSFRDGSGSIQMSVKPLKRLLPSLILVKADQAQSLALNTTLNLLASEMAELAPGSELVVNRLADVLFIQCLRAHIASCSKSCKSGWLRAVFDPQIGVVLSAMHEKVEHPWTVESLAAACGMSRSAFALRFKALVGENTSGVLDKLENAKGRRDAEEGRQKAV